MMGEKMSPRDELKAKLAELGEPIPNRIGKMSISEIERHLRRVDAALETAKTVQEPKGPVGEPGQRGVNPLPDQIDECMGHLLDALRLYVRRRMWLSSGSYDKRVVETLKTMAKDKVRTATGCVLTADGRGYERGSKLASLLDFAITEMRTEFTDWLVANTVMATLMSEKHMMEMESIREQGEKK